MLFNSFAFFIFLPIVFILYWKAFDKNIRLQNIFVIIVSYIFYGWWDWRFLFLIAFTSGCSYLDGILIKHYLNQGKTTTATAFSVANIVINLAILGVFKYYNFFAENLQSSLQFFNYQLDYPSLKIILPVGISFYTFQALSYTIDVRRNKIEPTRDPFAFFAYVCFFPQLVAGPIERATNLLPQFLSKRSFNYDVAVDGCRQMLWGFFKKIVIADNCAYYANYAFGHHNEISSLTLLLGALFFTFQIYGDFSGYSSIAIGCAKLFGIRLQPNFKVPYFSRDVAEFWKRWHISLNKWFVDYVYIPLGGSRVSKIKIVRNIFVIFLLSGLWHGANWTYIAWGFYHACLFLPLILLNKNHKYSEGFQKDKMFPSLADLGHMLVTFILVMFGWILFRADTITQAYEYVVNLFNFNTHYDFGMRKRDAIMLIGMIVVTLLVEWWNRNEEHEFKKIIPVSYIRTAVYALLIASIYISFMMLIDEDNIFIYFQF